MDLISAIVPVYNVEKYLYRCVDSILKQTYENFELILIDDGSPDNCSQMCDELSEKDSRIKVIHQENQGLSAARNSGIKIAKGNYLTFIDSDDWISNTMFEDLINLIKEKNADISICNFIVTDGNAIYKKNTKAEDLIPKNFIIRNKGTKSGKTSLKKSSFSKGILKKENNEEDQFESFALKVNRKVSKEELLSKFNFIKNSFEFRNKFKAYLVL